MLIGCSMVRPLLVAGLIGLSSLPVSAQDVSDLVVEEGQGSVLAFLSGPLDTQHVAQLQQAILDHPTPDLFYLVLDSDGGDVEAGLALGRMMRDLGIYGAVPSDAECLSSCALALFGAQERILLGSVGLHRPYYWVSAGAAQPTATEIRAMYNEVEAYFEDMQVPRSVFEEMMRIEPENMRVFRRMGDRHEVDGIMPRNDPVYAERRANLEAARYGMDSTTYRVTMRKVKTLCQGEGTGAGEFIGIVACHMATFYGTDEMEAVIRLDEASRVCTIPEEDSEYAMIFYSVLLEDYFQLGRDEFFTRYLEAELNRYFFFDTLKEKRAKDACIRSIMSGERANNPVPVNP